MNATTSKPRFSQSSRRLLSNTSTLVLAACINAVAFAAAPYTPGARIQPSTAANHLSGFALAGTTSGFGLLATASGSAYTFSEAAGTLTLSPALSSGVSNDLYGISLAAAQPGSVGGFFAVGAYGDDTTVMNGGKVYLYRRDASGFTASGTVVPPVAVATGNFGYSLAMSADLLFVGEVKAQQAATEIGAVHVYRNTAPSTWTLVGSVFGTTTAGRFGHALAVSGNTLVVGAPREVIAGSNIGALHVYTFNASGALTAQQVLTPAPGDAGIGDELGATVAISGNTIAAGSARDDKTVGVDAGSAYVFVRNGVTWTQEAKLRPDPAFAAVGNLFGTSVAVDGDEVSVGGYCESGLGCVGTGKVDVFKRSNGVWTGVQRFSAADTQNGEGFGFALSYVGRGGLVMSALRAAPSNAGALYYSASGTYFANGFE